MMARNIDRPIAILSVGPSVCRSPVLYQNGLTYHQCFFNMVVPSF